MSELEVVLGHVLGSCTATLQPMIHCIVELFYFLIGTEVSKCEVMANGSCGGDRGINFILRDSGFDRNEFSVR